MFCAPVAKQEQFIAYALDSLCRTREKKLKNSGLNCRSNPRIAWNKKIANEYSTFFHIHVHVWLLNKTQIPFFILFSFFFFFLTDIDECKTYPYKCHVNALCNNTHGSHVCTCKPGYTGDGRNCTGTVNNLRSLHIRFDYYNEFLYVVAEAARARTKCREKH